MKRILMFIFLIGLFAIGWSTPPPGNVNQSAETVFVKAADQVQADVIYAADETALPTSDTPAPVKWVDENLLTMASGILLLVYEFLALKMPTSKSISILGNLYKLLTFFVPDKSNKGGQFSIRDKL
ncbi:MAG TPA: hypothetical protein VFC67_21035 [Prolixibacteraceae bacterium]|nr:hypothetical protein [Prolixibacteraceae bacterium]